MIRKKILIVGDGNSVFVKGFIEKFSALNVIVDLISISSEGSAQGVRRQWNCGSDVLAKRGKVFTHLHLYRSLRLAISESDLSYDCVVMHYVFAFLSPHASSLKRKTKNFTVVIWGSDYYKGGRLSQYLRKSIYRRAQHIVFTNPKTKKEFAERVSCSASLDVARFGLPVLGEIDKIRLSGQGRSELCEFFDLPADKILILAGYNSNRSQNQLLIIEGLGGISGELKKRIHLVFPLGYGIHDQECELEKGLAAAGVSQYSMLRNFYNAEEVAKLRCITDILINIQPTDQFSGSMQETLYAGGLVITGNWLPYEQIISVDSGLFILINSPEAVGLAIDEVVKAPEKYLRGNSVEMQRFIRGTSGWESNLGKWKEILLGN